MSCKTCKKCDLIQQDLFDGDFDAATYTMIGEGNVLVCGCKDHVTELLVRVRTKTEKMDDRDHRIMLTGFLHGISESVKQIAKNMDISSPDLNRITESIDRIVKASLEQLPEVTHEMKTTFLANFETKHE